MNKKLENLKLESWVRNVMRVLGYSRDEAINAAARIHFGLTQVEVAPDIIQDSHTWRFTCLNGDMFVLQTFNDSYSPYGFRFKGERAEEINALFSCYFKLSPAA